MIEVIISVIDEELERIIKEKEDELRILYREKYKRNQVQTPGNLRPYRKISDPSIKASISASVANYFVYHIGKPGKVDHLDCYAAACEYLSIPKYGERYLDTEVTLNDITIHMKNLKRKWINGWRG